MQTVSSEFTDKSQANFRRISWSVLISFEKDFDNTIDFFTIGSSTIGGTDILKGTGSVIQEWDKYTFEDFSSRVLSVEVNRETEQPTSPLTVATCDIILDNHDDIFTPGNTDSPLDGFLLTRRPIKVSLGFSGQLIPKFTGLTIGKPEIDDKAKTARIHCVDFLKSMLDQPLDEELIYVDQFTSEINQGLLENAGLVSSQFSLEQGGIIIPFAYFKKGSKRGDAFRAVNQAELGNMYMAENGQIKSETRTSWANHTKVWDFTKENILERNTLANDNVINVVEVFSQARQVQAKQSLWQNDINSGSVQFSDQTDSIKPGQTKELFIDIKDEFGDLPITTLDDPEPYTTADTSYYVANAASDSTGIDLTADVDLDSMTVFSTAAKLVFTNNGTKEAFITRLEVFGTPAKVVNDIYKRVVDATSVGDRDAYEEHPLSPPIVNDLIQDETAANTIGQIIIGDRGEDDDRQKWLVKAVPQLQVGDVVNYTDENTDEDYFVTRINDIVNNSGYRQILEVTKRTINTYFRIGISSIGGTDVLGP